MVGSSPRSLNSSEPGGADVQAHQPPWPASARGRSTVCTTKRASLYSWLQVERLRTRSSAPGLTPVSITEFAATESSRAEKSASSSKSRRRPRRARHRPKTLSLHSCPPASGATATGVPRKTPVPYSRPVRRTYCRLSCGVRRRQSAATSLPPRLCLTSVVKSAPLYWFMHKLTGKCDGPVTFCVRGCDMV